MVNDSAQLEKKHFLEACEMVAAMPENALRDPEDTIWMIPGFRGAYRDEGLAILAAGRDALLKARQNG